MSILPALGFIACERPENADFSVSPETTELFFEAAYPTPYTFQVSSGTDDWDIVSDAEWLTVKKEGNNVTITAAPNVTFNDLAATVSFTTGKKTRMTVSATQKALQVYVAGNENDVTTYWHNGRKFPMAQLGNALNGIYVTRNGDVHLVGKYLSPDALSVGFYYSQATGRVTTVVDEKNQGNAFSVFVDETKNDVYYTSHEGFVDYATGASNYVASYWKNQQRFPEENSMLASDILVDNGKVYVLFDDYYKKDNEKIQLEEAGEGIYPSCMTIHNGDAYIGGYYLNVDKFSPIYWINGKAQKVPSTDYAMVYGIAVAENGDVYLSGSEGSWPRAAAYWKNGEKTLLSDYSNACAGNIFVFGNHVLVTGFAPVNDISTAKMWMDGVESNISDGTADVWIEDTFIR